jgi:hypothetical protein
MKFSLWTNHGALNSKPIFDAFAHSLVDAGHTVVWNDYTSDVDVIWSVLWHGRMAQNKAIWDRNMAQSKPTVVLEVGGIKRGTTWKVGLNGINRDGDYRPSGNNNDRARSLGLTLKPWRTDGKYILICGQHNKSLQWQGMPSMSQWMLHTINQLQIHYDYPIIIRPHPRCPVEHIEKEFKDVYRQNPKHVNGTYDDFDMNFQNIKFTVSWNSNPGIHSIINGVPAHVGPNSLAFDVACPHLLMIDNPHTPDRQQWLNDYAWTEFTVDEIASGLPLKQLTHKLF